MAQFRIMRDDGWFRWIFVDDQGETIAESAQSYPKKSKCEDTLERVRKQASEAEVEDHTEAGDQLPDPTASARGSDG